MIEVSGSILSANLAELGQEVARLEAAGCDSIHVDVMDGHYVPNLTFGAMLLPALRPHSQLPFDVHLMVQNPEAQVAAFGACAGVHAISFHPETTPHPHRLIQQIRALNILPGLVLNPGLSFEAIAPLLPDVDRVLIMTVNPGFGGQRFIASQLAVIQSLKAHIQAHKLDLRISVDGGINLETGQQCIQAGASILVTGHSLFTAPHQQDFVMQLKARGA